MKDDKLIGTGRMTVTLSNNMKYSSSGDVFLNESGEIKEMA